MTTYSSSDNISQPSCTCDDKGLNALFLITASPTAVNGLCSIALYRPYHGPPGARGPDPLLILEAAEIPAGQNTAGLDRQARSLWQLEGFSGAQFLRSEAVGSIADGLAKARLGVQSGLLFRRLQMLASQIPDYYERNRTEHILKLARYHAGLQNDEKK